MKKKLKLPNPSFANVEQKVETEANDIRTKYPEIAKMTVADIVATEAFAKMYQTIISVFKPPRYYFYAFQSLKKNNTLEIENFRKEYIACLDKHSNMPVIKRVLVLELGKSVYQATVRQMMKEYDNNKK